jgi:hypothetical protein
VLLTGAIHNLVQQTGLQSLRPLAGELSLRPRLAQWMGLTTLDYIDFMLALRQVGMHASYDLSMPKSLCDP